MITFLIKCFAYRFFHISHLHTHTHTHIRHPDPIERPSFQDVMLSLLQQDRTVLAIPDEELNNDTQAGLLGAVLQSSDKLYYNLQQTYCVELTHM